MKKNNACTSIINPVTQRCVLKNGNIGKHIIGRPKRCFAFRNPQTSRCVRSRPELYSICVPKRLEKLAERCECGKIWLTQAKIGSGAFGKVYKACREGNDDYVVKVQKYDTFAKAELNAYLALKGKRITPKLYAAWTCRGKLYLIMERLQECEPTLKRVERIVEKLGKLGWLHMDIHPGNVMCTYSNRLVLIDFGYAVQRGHVPYANHPRKTYVELKKRQFEAMKCCMKQSSS